MIYIDFEYKGLPESLPIEKIVLRDRPKSINTSLRSILDGTSEITREEAEAEPTVEMDEDDGQLIINIPDTMTAVPSPSEVIEEYLQTDVSIPPTDVEEDDGELAALDVFFAVNESERRYSEEIQVADLLGELVSKLPQEQRTNAAMKNIHKFVTRFKELRQVFSIFDENGDVIMPKTTDYLKKPIIDHIMNMDRDIKWILPVIYERNELISFTSKRSKDLYKGTDMWDFVHDLINSQHGFKNAEQTDANKYDKMTIEIDTVLGSCGSLSIPFQKTLIFTCKI